eukprot:TRINITY_DN2310_c0_g1_i1.p1 TRINITY_DN2310_c0_g1~~TRINITY_DN2310_c0_g1_i1.p1  ORF type:complete len:173 (+),score=46.31 TRINITY_DN2310_c0_g1_i1:136-654(+)
MSYVETVEGVTLHKMVNNSWETIDETCRLDVMFDAAQNMHYVAAQTPSGKFPIRTYITSDIGVQYVPTDAQFHTWWIPDDNNSLQAWSLMFASPQDASNFQLAVTKAGTGSTEGGAGQPEAAASTKASETTSLAVDFAAMKGELTNLRKDLLVQFKKDLETAKEEIMTALRK